MVEDYGRTDERKQFMKPIYGDPMKKREEFSVSLRKKRKEELIKSKRQKISSLMNSPADEFNSNELSTSDEGNYDVDSITLAIQSYLPNELLEADWPIKMDFLLKMILEIDPQYAMNYGHIEKTRNVLRLIRSSMSNDVNIKAIEFISQTNCLYYFGQLLTYLMNYKDDKVYFDLINELTWCILNFSSSEEFECSNQIALNDAIMMNIASLLHSDQNSFQVNAIWILSNIFGELNLELTRMTLNKTNYMDYLGTFICQSNSQDVLEQMAWSLCNILSIKKYLTYEEIQVILRTIVYITEQFDPTITPNYRRYRNKTVKYICSDNAVLDSGLKLFGTLLSKEDRHARMFFEKFGDLHLMIAQNVLTIDIYPGEAFLPNSVEHKTAITIVKLGIWVLSNISACQPIILERLFDNTTIDRVKDLALQYLEYTQNKRLPQILFVECMYFLLNLITNSTREQFIKLVQRDYIDLLVMLLKEDRSDKRLIGVALEALDRYFNYDKEVMMQGDLSIIDYFCANQGDDYLQEITQQENFELYNMATALWEKYIKQEDDFIFSQQYQNNANIYDDTRQPPEIDENGNVVYEPSNIDNNSQKAGFLI
ncbi:importin alpha [Stylonychia lemnae]|uniref:Importin alpha n=1 Tax=Stylonychia lemnae TaxID=5949 RepID=A0A078A7U7_STYLE|nr:importin alpha [Stylonychia lemnae]|eukprot:CDW78335.1 importin alpha [Stylonychia lemnae]